jgi:ribosomal-protein-alanine N-acetyltransferase
MNTEVRSSLHLAPMTMADVDEVFGVELSVYPHPWTRGNFADSLASGYLGRVLRDDGGKLLGYFLLMGAVHEAHLLNVAVRAERQGEGLGRYLLDTVVDSARELGMESVLLEVRPSNVRALKVYEQYGFTEIGRRKAYYPDHNGQREDAIVMRFVL